MAYFCCSNCFKDTEVKGYINTNSTNQGRCNFCETEDTALIDTIELTDMFQTIVDAYTVDDNNGELQTEAYLLHERLIIDWPNLFRIVEKERIKLLLEAICVNEETLGLLNVPVKINVVPDEDQEIYWDNFVKEVKFQNRFFLKNNINLSLLKLLFEKNAKQYKKGKFFYRARISSAEGLAKESMGKPPYDKAVAGRANPRGISYLYVSNDTLTTLYETRSTLHDFVTVGEFKLLEDIKVLNLRDTNSASPFLLENSIKDYLIHRQYLSRLEYELSKPVRRQDSELDYLPTQYLCEFVKSLGFDGVEYRSSLNHNGFNIAVYNDSLFECIRVKVYEVNKLEYGFNSLNN